MTEREQALLRLILEEIQCVLQELQALREDQQGTLLELGAEEIDGYMTHKLKRVFGGIKAAIQSISASLWTLVSKYLNLKEWSIKGIRKHARSNLFIWYNRLRGDSINI